MKYTSEHCCGKTVDDRIASNRTNNKTIQT